MARSLRFWLSLGLAALVGISALLVAAILLGVLLPRLVTQVETENQALAEATALQVERFGSDFAFKLGRLASELGGRGESSAERQRTMIDTLVDTDPSVDAIYLLDDRQRVLDVGLPRERRGQRADLIGGDLSGRSFVLAARREQRIVWSDTYLSVRGAIVVAVALPLDLGRSAAPGLLVAELDLRDLSRFAAQLGEAGELLPIIVDRRGNILGHPEPERSLRQENLGHLPPLGTGNPTQPRTARFHLDGVDYMGSATPIHGLGWTALVAQPTDRAFAILRSTLLTFAAAALISLALAFGAAMWAGGRVSRRVAEFATHLQAVADGDYRAPLPRAGTEELEGLSRSMRKMADAVLEREAHLRASEARFRDVATISADWIWEVDAAGRYTYASDSVTALLGYAPEEVIGRTPFDLMPAEEAARLAEVFRGIVERGEAFRDLENQVLDRQGERHVTLTSGRPIHDGDGRLVGYRGVDRDITLQRRAQEAQRLAATVFSASTEGICIADAASRILSVNPALVAITGYGPEEILGRTPAVFQSGRHDKAFYRQMWAALERDGIWRGEVWNRRKSGAVFPEWLTITAVRDDRGAVTHYIGSFTDLSERKRQEEHIDFLAHHDPLTRLPNRSLLEDRLHQALAKAHRRGERTAVLFLDLDRFKLINDTLGHDIGDRLLESVASRLRYVLRETETVARLGGDEFVVVIPELDHLDQAALVAKKVQRIIDTPVTVDEQTLHVTPSIGISVYPDDGGDPQTLLRAAETAMYHAKEHGRNGCQFFTAAMNEAVQHRVAVENDLHLALERGEFELHYQPQVHGASRRIIGMEALIRWRHPTRGMIPPDLFIPVAEETGLILPIGQWVLEEACRQARRWHEAGHPHLRMGVNLSPRQLADPDLYERVATTLEAAGIEPATLELELTESMLMTDPAAATRLLQRLAGLGLRMAIDDFGTGYSSLAYLKHFPVSRLKIDRAFVRDLSTDANDAAIVKAVIAMAESLQLEVIAEGVETEEQLHYLIDHGCQAVQGYYFSRPRPAADLDASGFALNRPG